MFLDIHQLETGYGKKPVLFGVDMAVAAGEIVAVIGPNGAGKSTVLKAVHGMLPVWRGEIAFEGIRLNDSTPAENVRRGIGFCPQGNRVFTERSVRENLEVGGFMLGKKELRVRIDEMGALFPLLAERGRDAAGKLSGGEQQMVAIARALIPRPKLLLLDEPSLGLSPKLITTVFEKIVEINRTTGVTVLIVEQKVRDVLAIAHRVYGLRLGRVAYSGEARELAEDKAQLKDLFL